MGLAILDSAGGPFSMLLFSPVCRIAIRTPSVPLHASSLNGTPVRVFQSRYTFGIVYRLVFFMYRKVLRYTQGPPKFGYRKIMLEDAASTAAQATVSFLSRYRGYRSFTVANCGLKRH